MSRMLPSHHLGSVTEHPCHMLSPGLLSPRLPDYYLREEDLNLQPQQDLFPLPSTTATWSSYPEHIPFPSLHIVHLRPPFCPITYSLNPLGMQSAPNENSPGQGARPSQPARTRSPPAKRRRTNLPTSNIQPAVRSSPPSSPSPSPSPARSSSPLPRSPSPPSYPQHKPQTAAKWFRKPSVVWYRGNDLRVEDHPALLAAAQRGGPVVPFFVWDPLDGFGLDLGPVKQWWLRESLKYLQKDLRRLGVQLYTRTGRSTDELRAFLDETGADAVFWNRCYEPDLLKRDEELRVQLAHEGLTAESFKAELLVEPWELSNTDISPCFETFHSYMRAWMNVPPPPQPFPCPSHLFPIGRHIKSVGIDSLGFDIPPGTESSMRRVWKPGSTQAKIQLDKFLHEVFPAFGEGRCRRHFDGTSRLSPHIRFGELSPRRMYHSTRLRVSQWDHSGLNSTTFVAVSGSRRSPLKRPKTGRVREPTHLKEVQANNRDPVSQGRSMEREIDRDTDLTEDSGCPGMKQPELRRMQKKRPLKPDVLPRGGAQLDRRKGLGYRRPSLPHIASSARAFLKNLCLRDFSYHMLFHNPEFNKHPLIPEFNNFPWAEDNGSFESWRKGVTGYPIVDAAMRELRETGWIHNGMRFLLACFLTKYLLLPWSRGLKAFYGLLVDGDHSSNALGWQWTAGSNTDAFPFSCLVNPVKVAHRHDPSGNYVRKWIPELAKLPTEFIHQPWKAPQELLSKHGIEIGSNYPKRVVMMTEARHRASKAMSVMKQIFASSTVRRSVFNGKEGDEVREWPDSQPDALRMESVQSSSGKIGLLPSLWALLQCDPAPSYLAGTSSGSDALIAMDTVSLVDGALPVPLDEQHGSIEHALISAHEQGPDPGLATVGVLSDPGREIDGPSFGSHPEYETGAELRTNPGSGGMNMQQLEEPLKYTGSDMNAFPDQEKQILRPGNGSSAPSRLGDIGGSPLKVNQELRHQQSLSTTSGFASGSHSTAFNNVATQYTHGPQPHLQQQLQQFQQFQQLHALGMQRAQQQQQQQQAIAHVRHPTSVVPSQNQLAGHQPVRQMRDTQQERTHQPNRPQPQMSHSQSQPLVSQSSQGQSLHPPVSSVQQVSQSQRQLQVHQSQAQNVMEGLYNPAAPSNLVHGTSLAGVSLTAAPVMMGPVSNGVDPSTGHAFGGTDPGNALYSHHLGMNQFYGFPPVMSVMNTPHTTSNERFEMLGVSAATNSQKLTVPGMVPLGYGMYGGGVFEPSVMNNPFAPNGNSYGAGPMNPQSHAHPSQQSPYGLPTQAMYCPQPPGTDVPRPLVARDSHLAGSGHGRPGSIEPGVCRNKVITATNLMENATGDRDMTVNASSEAHHRDNNKDVDGDFSAQDRPPKGRGFAPPSSPITRTRRSGGSISAPVRGSPRIGGKGGVKGKQSSKTRRSGKAGTSSNRPTAENRSHSGIRAKAGDRNLHRNKAAATDKGQASTLKSRKEMLTSVLESKEHEYHAFAHYLSVTYELTGNTDRQTSRDYIRLRNLKEDYLRQFPAEKDKLKIYSMKRFFSQYLNLEVTGEWDRHSHGGVRGPYVYGIRARTQTESSGSAVKS